MPLIHITPTLAPILLAIGDILLPLDDWVKRVDRAMPKTRIVFPWRSPNASPQERLNLSNLGFIEHYDNLLKNDRSFIDRYDVDDFINYAAALVDKPMLNWPLGSKDKDQWRLARGLKKTTDPAALVRFDPKIGKNIDITRIDTPKHSIPSTRLEAFKKCDVELHRVVALRKPSNQTEWRNLVDDLKRDASESETGWSLGVSGVKSSEFLVFYTRDIILFAMGQKFPNAQIISPEVDSSRWDRALLLELGESRKPGNRFTGADTEAAVKAFKTKLEELAVNAATPVGGIK